jgi:putative ABC transport system permease protein
MLWSSMVLALKTMRRNLTRSFLTMLGIVIGVSAVITMVTIGNGATQAVSDQISSLGSNLLIVMPGQRQRGPGGGGSTAPSFKKDDVEAVRSQIGGIKALAPTTSSSATVVAMSKNWSTSITGTDNDYFVAGNWTLAAGRTFTDAEVLSGSPACVIGNTVRTKLFGGANPVGSDIRVKSFSCQVIGLLKSKGQASMGRDQDDTVIMPLRTVQRRLAGSQDIASMMVSAKSGASTDVVRIRIEKLMRERRRITDGKEDDFNVLDTKEIATAMSGATQVLTALLGAVAAVSLLVGGIGIMNIMLVSVTERTREIGTRLAIGALEREVLLQFLVEAVTLSSLGGLIGMLLATLASIGLSKLMSLPYTFNAPINILAFVFSAAMGVLFGFLPAKRAASLDPIEALRHE